MQIEWEATFWPVQKDEARRRLETVGATQIYSERLMRRKNFYLPESAPTERAWLRVRDEEDRVTLSMKRVGTRIDEQEETELVVDSFEEAQTLLRALGCRDKAYQETKREMWELGDVMITIDEWPFIEPFVEIEGPSEAAVQEIAKALGFSWEEAIFGAADELYVRTYGIEKKTVNEYPELRFSNPNPFAVGH